MLKRIKKNNYLLVYLLVIAVVNIYLQTLPLTNVFGYEFSAVNALLISFLSGLYLLTSVKTRQKETNIHQKVYLFKPFALMLLIPFAISFMKSFLFGFCSFWDGLLFYLVITIPSVIIGAACGAVILRLIKRVRIVGFILLYLLILLIPVLEIYFNPQIYLYNPLFAYFPGTIYDEGLSVDSKLVLYRFFNLIFFFSLLLYGLSQRKSNIEKSFSKLALAMVTIVLLVFYFVTSPVMGFTTTESCLEKELSVTIESNHFLIYADKIIPKNDLELIVLYHEYSYTHLTKFYNEYPDSKITSYIFIDRNQKKKLFGSGSADVAKPWLNSIYISYDSWENTVRHEIAHCFTASFGTGIFKLAAGFNPALIEGVAEAADGFYDENSIHHLASVAYKNNYRIDLNFLFSSFSFFSSVSSISYIYSGSFIKYLATQYGIEKVKQFYKSNEFENTYQVELAPIIQNYEIFLDSISVESTKAKADYYFGSKPLISKVCPRYISSSLENAWNYYSLKEYDNAECIFNEVLAKAENFSAIIGLASIYEEKDSIDTAINLLKKKLDVFSGTSGEYNLKFRLTELLVKNSNVEKALHLYKEISDVKPNRRLEMLANTRLQLAKDGTIKSYVSGSDFDKYILLKKLNSKSYNYYSIPLMMDLSILLKEDYKLFLNNFYENFEVNDEVSSYAVYKLSEYMLQNFDLKNALKLASLALRYKDDSNLTELLSDHLKKTEWFVKNTEKIKSGLMFTYN